MRVKLKTFDISDYERRVIANYYGEEGLASHETCRLFLEQAASTELEKREADLQYKEEDEEADDEWGNRPQED